MTERWRPVPGARWYQVSDAGRVWSILGRKMLAAALSDRRMRVKYTDDTGRRVTRALGPLVLEAFGRPRPPGMECCHGPGGEQDNRLANLRWDTPEANRRDRYGDSRRCPQCDGSGRVHVV